MPFQSHVQFSGMGEYILGAPKEAPGQTSSAHIVGFLLFGASFPPKARKSRGNNVARTKVSSARHLLTTAGRDKFWGPPRCFVFAARGVEEGGPFPWRFGFRAKVLICPGRSFYLHGYK